MKRTLLLSVLFWGVSASAGTMVYLTKDDALKLYFPDAQIERKTEYLSAEQKNAIKSRARAPMESSVIIYYIAKKNTDILGYAFFESVTVRTKTVTYMVAMNPNGKVRGVELLAFYEPEDYQPSKRWLGQFHNKDLKDDLQLRSGIKNITGATLSAQTLADGIRRILSIYSFIVSK